MNLIVLTLATATLLIATLPLFAEPTTKPTETNAPWQKIEPFFTPPKEYEGKLAPIRNPLTFNDGTQVKTPEDWQRRRKEILETWHKIMGPWPELLKTPKLDISKTETRENFTQHTIAIEVTAGVQLPGYLLIPEGKGPFPAVLVVYYDAETSIGTNPKGKNRDWAYQLVKKGFVTLAIGRPLNDARDPVVPMKGWQPLSHLAYIAANCHTALTQRKEVDPARIGIVGHSFGGKWAMMASCLYEKFAAAVWCDPDVVFDESKPNANYWEPWYLGREEGKKRERGVVTKENPRTGAYKYLMENNHDLTEIHALMAPRPVLISGGAEDPPDRWPALNHLVEVNKLLGQTNKVALTQRETHGPTPESNEQIVAFFEHFLGTAKQNP
jgi:hypothetical protein